jgi:integrase
MERHLYKRTIAVNDKGEDVKAWYFWYYDPDTKKQVRKSCGTSKKPVLLRREAKAIIDKLAETDREYLAIRAENESITIAKMAEAMFKDDSNYLKRRRDEGYVKEKVTLREIKGYLKKFIVEKYGNLKPEEIDPVIVNNDLINTGKSSSWRNRATSILDWILDEAIWLKMIRIKPVLKYCKRTTKNKSILSQQELDILFPDNIDDVSKIWDREKADTAEGFMFGTLFALMVSTGLRNGEARAINPSQLILSDGKKIAKMVGSDGREAVNPLGETTEKIVYGLLIDRMYNQENKIAMHLKKGDDEKNKKMRIEVIPEKTVKYIKHWLSIRPTDTDLLFPFNGHRLRCEYVIQRFEKGIKNAEINTEGRILKPHSLRYTYNTKMRRKIPEEKLRAMMGHDYKGMTDYYTIINIAELEEQFLGLRDNIGAIDSFWGQTASSNAPISSNSASTPSNSKLISNIAISS